MKEKILKIGLPILLLIIVIIVFILCLPGSPRKQKDSSANTFNSKIEFDTEASTTTTAAASGTTNEIAAMMVVYLKEPGNQQEATFKVKNVSKEDVTLSKDDFEITYRPTSGNEENTFYVDPEEWEEYYTVEILKPTTDITLKKGESTELTVNATLKKSMEENIIAGGFDIKIKNKNKEKE